MELKVCQHCGNEIKGRIDKKFCDDQCRTAFNNRLKTDSTVVKAINTALRKNRKILEDFIPKDEGKIKVSRQRLLAKNFNFTYHTHIYKTKAGATYYFCYEYGYLPLESDFIMLVKRNEES